METQPTDQTHSTLSESSSKDDPSTSTLQLISGEPLSDEAPLLALLSEDLDSWNDHEKAKAFVAKLQQARQSPQTLKALLAVESDGLEKRRAVKERLTPEQKAKAALDKLMGDLGL